MGLGTIVAACFAGIPSYDWSDLSNDKREENRSSSISVILFNCDGY